MSIFTCKSCGRTVSRIYGPVEPVDTCAICDWINNNQFLSPTEKEELRKRLCRLDEEHPQVLGR